MKAATVLASWCLVAVCPCRTEAQSAALCTPEDWAAIDGCLGIIRQCQMGDGMIRMKGDGDHVWTVPYVSDFAAMALLAVNDLRPNLPDVRRVEQWLLWYAENQQADGTICDQTGTVASYRSNGGRDSTDSYAATFLMAASRYRRATQGVPPPKITQAVRLALRAIIDVIQPDGLTIAKPDYQIKYLMDNIEVYGGLTEVAAFFESVGEPHDAQKAREMAVRVAVGLRGFWSRTDGSFAVSLDRMGKYSAGLEKPYPHGLAQLFALAHVDPGRREVWRDVRKRFKPGDQGMPVERWLMAANRCGSPQEQRELRVAARREMLQFTAKTVYVDRPALAILAILDGNARFADLPVSRGVRGR